MSLALRQPDAPFPDLPAAAGLAALPGIAALCQRIDRALALRHPFAMVLVDPDRFALVNACHGEAHGDAALAALAAALPCDVPRAFIARTGGANFSVLLPQVEPQAARAYAARVQREGTALLARLETPALRELHARDTGRRRLPRRLLGLTVALVHCPAGAGGRPADVLTRLQQLASAAKSAGGDRVAA